MNMREKIARAIHGDGQGIPFDEIKYARLDQADAVLDALMEPDESGLDAFARAFGWQPFSVAGRENARHAWQAILTAARNGA